MVEMKPEELDSLQLIRAFIDSKKALFLGIEMIVYSPCIASVTMSVESTTKSFVSVYENRNNKKRLITEKHAHHEMLVAINGPEFAHSNSLVKEEL